MVEPELRSFWVRIRGGEMRIVQAHNAEQSDADLVFYTTAGGRTARMVVALFPLDMVDAWGDAPPPSSRRRPGRVRAA